MFITFEGGEGVGKSTQIRALFEKLKEKGIDVVLTREPGGCASAEQIRRVMLNCGVTLDVISQLFLVMAARREHYIHTIKPSLDKGKWVLCDRFIDSTLVYQGLEYADDILRLHAMATEGLMPDITFLLDADPQVSLSRMQQRGIENHMDSLDIQRHMALRNDYLSLVKKFPERIYLIDSRNCEENTFSQIESIMDDHRFFSAR